MAPASYSIPRSLADWLKQQAPALKRLAQLGTLPEELQDVANFIEQATKALPADETERKAHLENIARLQAWLDCELGNELAPAAKQEPPPSPPSSPPPPQTSPSPPEQTLPPEPAPEEEEIAPTPVPKPKKRRGWAKQAIAAALPEIYPPMGDIPSVINPADLEAAFTKLEKLKAKARGEKNLPEIPSRDAFRDFLKEYRAQHH